MTQIVVTYLAGGWIVTSVVDQVVDREVLPLVVYEVTLTLFLFGILGALIIGWYHGEKGAQEAQKIEIAMLAVIGLMALGTSAQVVRSSLAEASLENAIDLDDLRRIAVLYLEDSSRDGSLQPLADGITEGLITSLASVRELDVRTRNASREARALGDVGVDSIAGVLGVGTLVDGTVDESGDELRVSIRLLEGQTGAALFRETFTWPAGDVANVGTELAGEVATALRARLGGEIRLREAEAEAPNAAAWLQVARAETFIKDAADAFQAGNPDAFVAALESAETELAAAQESAPEWVEPLILRSQVAYEWNPLAGSLDELLEMMDESADYADAALLIDQNNAAALEWRGTARYRQWLTLVGTGTASEDELDGMLASARSDLERSETVDPDRASANSTLSHLYYQVDDIPGAIIAARTAYQQDAFQDVADEVLWRLASSSYDLGESSQAQSWCDEGADRFPRDFRFVQCQILVMTMPDATPDVERAWEAYEELQRLIPERQDFFEAQARVLIGGILGKAGLTDSASVVMEGARVGESIDPQRELLSLEAAMRSGMGDTEEAIDLLQRWVVANPDQGVGEHWWWNNIASDPVFQRLRAQH